jgi:sugar fermentation stimulation protein A
MRYGTMVQGTFLARPNRFVAHIEIEGKTEICHVKNTGRCRELLPAGATVWCLDAEAPSRKTRYDLIAVKKGEKLINMDSQAPNAAVKEWLQSGGFGKVENIKAEKTFGDSRFDFYFEKEGKSCFMEVKGVTLEDDGICAFPDAPTDRGRKHIRELMRAREEGFGAYILFVIQMENVKYLHPNDATDPEFGKALRDAAAAGVQILAMDCKVKPEEMTIGKAVPVRL